MEPSSSGPAPGPRPDREGLEKTVSAVGLAALLREDQRRRWMAGERLSAEDYLTRYPVVADNAEAVLDLVYGEFVLREEQGEKPDVEDYLRRFPAHAAPLRRQFELHRELGGTLPSLPAVSPPLSIPAAPPLTSPPAERTWAEAPGVVPAGVSVPGYDLLNEVGRGGMGVVYKARHRGLDRIVALKMVLHADHAGATARDRLHTEARAVARLQHPNIVQVFEVGEHNGCPYLALEYCGGGSLADQLDGTPWPPEKAAALVETLARAMHAAHQAQVVHRDLKPANILFTREGTPKINDFGLARKLDEAGHTQSGEVLGTPSYMAPEQAQGRTRQVSPAADVYALGALLYEMLVGRPPFKAASPLDTVLLLLRDDPVPVRRLQPKVPRDLETICLKCLEKGIARRYASAGDLAEDLRRFQAAEPIRVRPVGPVGRTARWVKRRPAGAALAGISVAVVVLLVGLGLWFSARLGAARGDLAAEEARTASARQRAVLQEYFGLVRQARERSARPRAGWTWDNLDDLRKAALLAPATENAELLGEAAAALGAVDVRPVGPTIQDFQADCLAFHPRGWLLALGQAKAAGFLLGAVRLIDREGKGPPRTLAFPPDPVWEPGPGLVQDGVRSLAFSPDGRWLVAGARSGRLHRWDLSRDPHALESWTAHQRDVNYIFFATDGSALFSACARDGVVKRWNCRSWGCPRERPKNEETWQAPASLDGLALHPAEGGVLCRSGGKLHVLSAGTLRPVQPPADGGGSLLQVSPDGGTLAWADHGVIRCAPLRGSDPPRLFLAPDSDRSEDGRIDRLLFSPSGDLLLSASSETRHVKLWEAAGRRLLADWFVGGGTVRAAFSPDGRTLAVTADNRTLLYEVGGLDVRTFLAHQPQAIEAMALHSDGRSLACLSRGTANPAVQEIGVWALGEGAGPAAVARHTTPSLPGRPRPPLRFHPQRPLLALDAGGTLTFWDFTGQPSPTAVPGVSPDVLRFAPEGRLWAAVGNEVRTWDPGEPRPRATWSDPLTAALTGLARIYDLDVGRDWVAAGGRNGRVYLLRAADATPAASTALNEGAVQSVALGPGESQVAAGTDKGELRLLRVPSAEIVARASQHRDAITAVAFAGGLLASGSRDHTVCLWCCDGGRLDLLLTLWMPGPVRSVAFHPDGVRLFVLLERERAVRVWHLDRLRARLEPLGLAVGLEGNKP